MIKTLNQFLDEVCKACFVCGNLKYCEFYKNGHIYRICNCCLKKDNVIRFLRMIDKTDQSLVC